MIPARQDRGMVRALAFMVVRQVLGLIGLGPSPDAKDVEIAVLRHQLAVLQRQVTRPRYTPADRMVLAGLAKLLPRQRWPIFLVTPSTLLRWHRELIRRRWTYPAIGRSRRALDQEVVDLVLRLVGGLIPEYRSAARPTPVPHPHAGPTASPEASRSTPKQAADP